MVKMILSKLFKTSHKSTETGITILYGTKSGNSSFIAREAARYFEMQGIGTRVKNMAKYRAAHLAFEKAVLVVVSTHGEGEPPPGASSFFKTLETTSLSLKHLHYAVCALGDSDYEHFCRAGKIIDQRFRSLGAVPLLPRTDCDTDFRDTAVNWIKKVHSQYGNIKSSPRAASAKVVHAFSPVERMDTGIQHHESDEEEKKSSSTTTHSAIITNKIQLNPGSTSEIYHLETVIDPDTTRYSPGDAISVVPRNPSPLVDKILDHYRVSPDDEVPFKGQSTALGSFPHTTGNHHFEQKHTQQICQGNQPPGIKSTIGKRR